MCATRKFNLLDESGRSCSSMRSNHNHNGVAQPKFDDDDCRTLISIMLTLTDANSSLAVFGWPVAVWRSRRSAVAASCESIRNQRDANSASPHRHDESLQNFTVIQSYASAGVVPDWRWTYNYHHYSALYVISLRLLRGRPCGVVKFASICMCFSTPTWLLKLQSAF